MAFTLWTLFEATLLCLNAVCVLNEERFLAKGNNKIFKILCTFNFTSDYIRLGKMLNSLLL